jgi:photosystem II stability/assembly factor-like uncharacterized protein
MNLQRSLSPDSKHERGFWLLAAAMPLLWLVVGWVCVVHFRSMPHKQHQSALQHEQTDHATQERTFTSSLRYQSLQMLRDPRTGLIPQAITERERLFIQQMFGSEYAHNKNVQQLPSQVQSGVWQSLGPRNISGRTRALAVDVTQERVWLAGGATGGMWRSEDAGASWRRTTALNDLASVTCLAQDTRRGREQRWYYGTGEFIGTGNLPGNGIFSSNDGGRTWSVLASTIVGAGGRADFEYVHALALDPSNPTQDELYAATNAGIMRSADGGRSWQRTLSNNTSDDLLAQAHVVVTRTGVVYASICALGRRGMFRSPDGINWTDISPGDLTLPTTLPNANLARIVLAPAPSNESVAYAVVYTAEQNPFSPVQSSDALLYKYTYLSGDGRATGGAQGGRWENRTQNLPRNFNPQFGYNLALAVHPSNDNDVFLGGVLCHRSTDGFLTDRSITQLGRGLTEVGDDGVDHHTFTFLPSNSQVMLCGCDQGVKRVNLAALPARWEFLTRGYVTSQFYACAIDATDATAPAAQGGTANTVLVGGMQDNGTAVSTVNAGFSDWAALNTGDGGFAVLTNNARTVYTSAQGAALFRDSLSAPGGGSPATPNAVQPLARSFIAPYGIRIDPVAKTNPLFINPFALDPQNNAFVYLPCGRDLWRHRNIYAVRFGAFGEYNRSDDWERFANVAPNGEQCSAIATARLTAGNSVNTRLYVGTSSGSLYRIDNAQTAHLAVQAVDVGRGKGFPSGAYINCLAVDPANADRVVAVFSNYNVQSLFLTENGGATWTPIGGNLEERADGTGAGQSCRWLAMLNVQGTLVYYLGTSSGLFVSTRLAGMQTRWAQESPQVVGNVIVANIQARSSDGLVVAATHGNGVFAATVSRVPTGISTGVSTEPVRKMPSAPNVLVATPNPFASEVRLRYNLRQAAHVRLRIIDLAGREMTTLVHAPQHQGEQECIWNRRAYGGIRAAKGVYLAELLVHEHEFSVPPSRSSVMIVAED